MSHEHIQVERVGAVGRITLNRPNARNAQNFQLLDELDAAFGEFEKDASVHVIVLAASGPHFSAGHDLREAAAKGEDVSVEDRWVYEESRYLGYCLRMRDCPKPTIAQVQGACIAGGFMIANMCDLIVAAESAYFCDPVTHSLAVASLEVLVHPWVLTTRKAKEMLFTGEYLHANDALAAGLVNRVVPDEQLAEATLALATKIAKASPVAMMLTKRSINRTQDIQGFRSAVNAHFDTHQLSHRTEAYLRVRRQGVDSVLDDKKRKQAAAAATSTS
jgi:enoyl-CoA hydratase